MAPSKAGAGEHAPSSAGELGWHLASGLAAAQGQTPLWLTAEEAMTDDSQSAIR